MGVLLLKSGTSFAQYKRERDATIPLEYFYIERKDGSFFRKILSHLNVGINTGIGRTNFKHKLDGYGILQNPNTTPTLYNLTAPAAGYSNWFNTVTPTTNTFTGTSVLVSPDTAKLGFKSRAFSIPLEFTLHVEVKQVFRIGGGYSLEYMKLGDFMPLDWKDDIASFQAEDPSIFLHKYYGMLGGGVYRWNEYVFVVDGHIGGYRLPRYFDRSLIKKGVFFNFGVKIEKELSQNFKLFVRPSYDLKKFKLSIPEVGELKHKMNAVYLNFGFTYRFPELRKCVFKTCHTQINHAHGNREYRSRIHPFYKNQNPHYGENYPVLIKYKGRNKKKLNPY